MNSMDNQQINPETVNLLVPMAGAGSRFVQQGFTDPKPLIQVLGKPMVEWATDSFNFVGKLKSYRFIFVVLHEHIEKFQIDEKLKKHFGPNTIVITATGVLNGQSKSCLLAKPYINNEQKLFIYNCDTFMKSDVWDVIEKEDPDGVIPCFEATNPSYSYAKVDEQGNVTEVAEKQAISNLATIGMYYFKHGADYVKAAEAQIEKNLTYNNEFYVGPCYNEIIAEGKKVKVATVLEKWVIGTPEEMKNFEANYKNT